MSDEELIQQMIERGYMVSLKGKYSLTGNFHRNYVPVSSTGLVVAKKEVATKETVTDLAQLQPVMDVNTMFMEFIKVCEVPTRTSNGRGGFYWINRFHKDAAKEFARMLSKDNVNLQVLIASTKLYYKTTKECANTIANYIVLGIWRTGYQAMIDSMEKGTIAEDIKKELEAPKTSNMKVR
jgi:hypothetical protein